MGKYKIAIIIPAFNEEVTIFHVVQSVRGYGEVIVVNDASTDETGKIAEKAGATLVNHKKNKGYDSALNSGFVKAGELNCDVVITFDADGQHNHRSIKEYIDLLEQGFKVVVGVRGKFQRVSEYIFSWISIWKWGVKDPLCGMKAYRIDVFNQLGYFDSYNSIGTELAIYAACENIKIAQPPIKIKDRQDKPRFGNILFANINILRSLWIGCRKY
jgi:glycosyltransferase involved in cell wall biosynthesis